MTDFSYKRACPIDENDESRLDICKGKKKKGFHFLLDGGPSSFFYHPIPRPVQAHGYSCVLNMNLLNLGIPKVWRFAEVTKAYNDKLYELRNKIVLALVLVIKMTDRTEYVRTKTETKALNSLSMGTTDSFFIKEYNQRSTVLIAILHAVINTISYKTLYSDSLAAEFFNNSLNMTPEERGKYIETGQIDMGKDDEPGRNFFRNTGDHHGYHFITFVERKGNLVELDGHKMGSVNHHKLCDLFVVDAITYITRYMSETLIPCKETGLYALIYDESRYVPLVDGMKVPSHQCKPSPERSQLISEEICDS